MGALFAWNSTATSVIGLQNDDRAKAGNFESPTGRMFKNSSNGQKGALLPGLASCQRSASKV